MMECGIEADSICYNSVIDACAKAKDVQGAEKWAQMMLDTKVLPTTVTYYSVINACAKCLDGSRTMKWRARCWSRGCGRRSSATTPSWALAPRWATPRARSNGSHGWSTRASR